MKKPRLNYIVDCAGLLLLLAMLGTGLILYFRLPHGSGGATLMGLTRSEWGDIHSWSALGLLAVVSVHLVLHASWIMALTMGPKNGENRRLRAGVAIGAIVLLITGLLLTMLTPVSPGTRGDHGNAGMNSGIQLRERGSGNRGRNGPTGAETSEIAGENTQQ